MIGQKWDSCPVEVYTTVKNPSVENFAHGWKKWHGYQCGNTFLKRGSPEVKFLGNLKASDKKLGLRRTLTWIKYYPSMCCFQHFKVIIGGLGLVFKHFYMLQCIVSCSVLMTCLTPKGLLSPIGTIESLGKFPQCQFSLWFFETVFGGEGMYYQVLDSIYFFPLDLQEKNYAALIKKLNFKNTLGSSKKINKKLPKNYLYFFLWGIGLSLQ
jgi:hypothetical protein